MMTNEITDCDSIELREENRHVVEELVRSESKFRMMFEHSPDPSLLISGVTFIDCNQAAVDILHASSKNEVLQSHPSVLSPEFQPDGRLSAEKADEMITTAVRSGSHRFEWLHRRVDGEQFPVEVSLTLIQEAGETLVFTVWRDISERKLGERRTASLLNISQYPFTTEQDFFNHALEEVIGLTGSAIGYIYFYDDHKRQFILNTWSQDVMKECTVLEPKTVYDLDSTGIWGEAVRQRRAVMLNDFQAYHPLKKGLPDGHVMLKRFLTVPMIVDGDIVAVVGVANKASDYCEADEMQLTLFMDAVWKIVTRKRSEEERLNLEKQLLHAQKLESLGVLAGGIAHDFNNILTAIIGNADLALMRINKESPAVENLRRIEEAAARAADLAKQMLAYSGKGRFVVETIDLNRLLEDMLHMLEVSISKKAVLRLQLHQLLSPVEADATQLRQIIMNLVINASEAIGDMSGFISITTGCMECDRNYLKDVWLEENIGEGLYVYLEISDSGCGMDKVTMTRIFDPFFTTKFTGRGLGMAAVLGIVRGHKGAIKIYSELNKGTTFKILLPASDRPAPRFTQESQADKWQRSGTVLLVDDEITIREVGVAMLEELGLTTITANDGREALEVFRSTPDIDFVIMDLTMPHMDGEQCFRELRRLQPDIKVILSSGFNEQEVTQRFIGKGLAGFIQKPYRLSMLQEVIRTVTAHQTSL
jgi:PAS domain S-box-containing protein